MTSLEELIRKNKRVMAGVKVVRLAGTKPERAKQYAQFLQDEIQQGALPQLAGKNQSTISRAPLPSLARKLGVSLYNHLVVHKLYANLGDQEKEIVEIISKNAGISKQVVKRAIVQPDGLVLLTQLAPMMQHLLPEYVALPGCTSTIVNGEITKDGRIYHARNQDYPVIGRWEKNTTIAFHESREGIPYVAVSSAGLFPTLTAMNRAGLTIAVHAHFGRKFSFTGKPIFHLADEVIAQAKSLEEAFKIAKGYPRVGNWSFAIASVNDGSGGIIEMTPNDTRLVISDDGSIVHTNVFKTPEFRSTEALICGGIISDYFSRIRCMEEMISNAGGQIDHQFLMAALGSHIDAEGNLRVAGGTISVPTTVKSVVMAPDQQRLWVSTRKETPTSLGSYLEVDAQAMWKYRSLDQLAYSLVSPPFREQNFLTAVSHYANAYKAWHNENDAEKTLEELEHSLAAYPDDQVLMQKGTLLFKLGRFTLARNALEKVSNVSQHSLQVRDLFLARFYQLNGQEERAGEILSLHQQFSDPKLARAFAAAQKHPYQASKAGTIVIDLQFPMDVLEY